MFNTIKMISQMISIFNTIIEILLNDSISVSAISDEDEVNSLLIKWFCSCKTYLFSCRD